MAYTKDIESLAKILAELKEIKETITAAENRAVVLERAVCSIDESLPDDDAISKMKPGKDKNELIRALKLTKRAYDLVDELLGSPEPAPDMNDSAILPQARGNDSISLEAALIKFSPGKFNPGGKNTIS